MTKYKEKQRATLKWVTRCLFYTYASEMEFK